MKKIIVLLNMGGPNNLDEVKLFLTNMFNDKYIIGAPQPIRAMIAWLITTLREKEAKHNYSLLGGISPIVGHTKRLVQQLKKELNTDVFYVMRYTPPFADDIMENLCKYDEIFAFPMYPHYSQTTTKSSMEDFMESAKKYGIEEKIKTIDSYYDNELYNKAIVERIKQAMDGVDTKEYDLIFSAHGLTQKVIDKGDLYQKHILANAEATKKELQKEGIEFNNIHLAYQSRLGPMKWLRPYMSDKLTEFKDKKVLIYPISFTVDNSETEYELDIEYRELADKIGIADYKVAKAPNHHPYFIEMIKQKWEEN